MTEQHVEYHRRLAWLLGRRLPRGCYIGRCTRSHLAVLRSGRDLLLVSSSHCHDNPVGEGGGMNRTTTVSTGPGCPQRYQPLRAAGDPVPAEQGEPDGRS